MHFILKNTSNHFCIPGENQGYHRKWDAIFFIYNTNFEYSLKRVVKWMEDIRSHGSQNPKLVFVQNSFDIEFETKVDWDKIQIQDQPETVVIENFNSTNEQCLNNLLNKVLKKKWEADVSEEKAVLGEVEGNKENQEIAEEN